MPNSRLIVCEQTGRWVVALRMFCGVNCPSLCETRSWADCVRELSRQPADAVALELTPANLEATFERLTTLSREFSRARAVVLGARGMEPAEWLLREAGACHVVFSPRRVLEVARLVSRHLAARGPASSARAAVWDRLPWKD